MALAPALHETPGQRSSTLAMVTVTALTFAFGAFTLPRSAFIMLGRGASGMPTLRCCKLSIVALTGVSARRASLFVPIPSGSPLHLRQEALESSGYVPWQYTWQVRPDYDWTKPTRANYQSSGACNTGPFADIRDGLDVMYHGCYVEARQQLQDEMVRHVLAAGLADGRPWIVYTAGAMGAGKSHVMRWLSSHGFFALPNFVQIDLDRFRMHLPEWPGYVERDAATAGELTHREAGYCAEIVQEAALQRSKHVWVDGSLHDAEWYASEFRRIRKDHPQYRIAIFHVVADWQIVKMRASSRASQTGRMVPEESLRRSYREVPKAVRALRSHVDFYARIRNDNLEPELVDVRRKTEQGTIEELRRYWAVIQAEFAPQRHGSPRAE